MSALEIAPPPQTLEKGVDATVPSVDTGVQALVETLECSVQSSPVVVHQEVSATPGVSEVSVDVRPLTSEVAIQSIPADVNDKSVGTTVVEESVDPPTEGPPRILESIVEETAETVETVEEDVKPKETPTDRTKPAPKGSSPKRIGHIFKLPFRFLLCSAKPVEDGAIPAEATTSSNTTK